MLCCAMQVPDDVYDSELTRFEYELDALKAYGQRALAEELENNSPLKQVVSLPETRVDPADALGFSRVSFGPRVQSIVPARSSLFGVCSRLPHSMLNGCVVACTTVPQGAPVSAVSSLVKVSHPTPMTSLAAVKDK